jgi:hypothetical protein
VLRAGAEDGRRGALWGLIVVDSGSIANVQVLFGVNDDMVMLVIIVTATMMNMKNTVFLL